MMEERGSGTGGYGYGQAEVPHYHRFAETEQIIADAVSRYPGIIAVEQVGASFEKRPLRVARITAEPQSRHDDRLAVLFTAGQHGREHLSVEMGLRILRRFTDGYVANDPQVKRWLQHCVVHLIVNMNPDGSEYDFENGSAEWRKNRQHPTSKEEDDYLGIDLNRNWGFHWNEDGGTHDPRNDDYPGPAPFTALEVAAVRTFIHQHVSPGSEPIVAAFDFHANAEKVFFPFGYTSQGEVAGHMSSQQRTMLLTMADSLRNAIPAEQDKDGPRRYEISQSGRYGTYAKSGVIIDWLWGSYSIPAFTIEMYPSYKAFDPLATADKAQRMRQFMPDVEQIAPQTGRVMGAVSWLLNDVADQAEALRKTAET
jgi:carboxypeptidase T